MEQLEDPLLPVAAIVARCPARQLSAIYRIAAFEGADDLLRQLATARGKLRPGGVPDVQVISNVTCLSIQGVMSQDKLVTCRAGPQYAKSQCLQEAKDIARVLAAVVSIS